MRSNTTKIRASTFDSYNNCSKVWRFIISLLSEFPSNGYYYEHKLTRVRKVYLVKVKSHLIPLDDLRAKVRQCRE